MGNFFFLRSEMRQWSFHITTKRCSKDEEKKQKKQNLNGHTSEPTTINISFRIYLGRIIFHYAIASSSDGIQQLK